MGWNEHCRPGMADLKGRCRGPGFAQRSAKVEAEATGRGNSPPGREWEDSLVLSVFVVGAKGVS